MNQAEFAGKGEILVLQRRSVTSDRAEFRPSRITEKACNVANEPPYAQRLCAMKGV